MAAANLSDKALSIFTFAAYHGFLAGDPVREVVLDDGKGHRAEPDGVAELEAAGHIETANDRGRFTESGLAQLARTVDAIRATA